MSMRYWQRSMASMMSFERRREAAAPFSMSRVAFLVASIVVMKLLTPWQRRR